MNAPASCRARRSALYLPASNPRAIDKARSQPADIVILDLEDAVAPDAKDAARRAAIDAVTKGGFAAGQVAIRANGVDTGWGARDLAAIARSRADAVLVPKVSAAGDIARYNAIMADAHPGMELWAMIETCASIARLDEIAAMADTTRLSLWVIGTNDLAREMRARMTPQRTGFLPILALAVCAARAHGIAIIDGVCNEFRDLDMFSAEARQGVELGFDGKSLIHPAQVEPCNAAFSPAADEIAWARAVIAAFDYPENRGKGAISVNGRMVELLHLDQARRIVALSPATGLREEG